MSDTIYREDAIEVASRECHEFRGIFRRIEEGINGLSPADRPRGEWIIEIDVNGNTYGKCPICGMKQYAGQLNFCPDCGAKMKGADDEA